MSRARLLLVVALMLACSKKDEPIADTTAIAPAPAAPVPVSYAGKWTITVMPEAKDTVLLTYTLDATDTKTGWKLNLPGREPMEPRIISMDNDSVVVENGPYKSVLQKNVQVTTHSSMHMEGDKLVGTTTAHYVTKGADSVRVLRTSGTKM